MSFDFLGFQSLNPYPNPQQVQQPLYPQQMQQIPPAAMIPPQNLETPKIVGTNNFFSIVSSDGKPDKKSMVPVDVPDTSSEKRGRKKSTNNADSQSTGIVRAEAVQGTVEEIPTAYTYMETTGMLRETLAQIDGLNAELMQEFANVKHSRTMKNKYQVLVGISENVGSLLGNKIAVIREINSSISKSNEMDYKKDKDRRAASAAMDDDKYIADLYKGFIQNPINVAPVPQVPQVDPSIFGSGVVRADLRSGNYNSGQADVGYLNYMSNLSPEQNLMRYEGNGNVKQVVVYDAATGNKFFQMMDLSTGSVIPNVPVYDQMFMEDTTIDLHSKIAKNINLNETFPLIVINENVTSQY